MFAQGDRELVVDAVGEALVAFREKVLIPGVWDPEKGASIKTFFIGQALYHFIKVFREWWATEKHHRGQIPLEYLEEQPSFGEDPAALAVQKDEIARALKSISPTLKEIYRLMNEGFRQAEVAELLQMTVKQVESHLYRHRRAVGGAAS